MQREQLWKACAAFHGHVCRGLTIGYLAAIEAARRLELDTAKDEEVVCITENDACGVDAIQVILGCSVGKGNLLFKIRGKQAYSFYNRKTGKAVRLLLRPDMVEKIEASEAFIKEADTKAFFEAKEVKEDVPEHAHIFTSIECEECHERTAESMIRVEEGRKLCLDCYHPYHRFLM